MTGLDSCFSMSSMYEVHNNPDGSIPVLTFMNDWLASDVADLECVWETSHHPCGVRWSEPILEYEFTVSHEVMAVPVLFWIQTMGYLDGHSFSRKK